MKELDAANEHFSAAKRHLEEASESTEFDHQEHISQRGEELRAAERELEEVTRKIDEAIGRKAGDDVTTDDESRGKSA